MSGHEEMFAIAERALRLAKEAGADAAEAFVQSSRETSINLVGGYATPKEVVEEGVGLRVMVGQRVGLSGSQGVSDATLRDVARHAVDAARRVPESASFPGFRGPASLRAPAPLHPALVDVDPSRLAGAVEAASDRLAAFPDVTYSGVVAQSTLSRFAVANTAGTRAWDAVARERFVLEARVTRGAQERTAQDGHNARVPIESRYDCAKLVDDTVERARSAFDARPLAGAVEEVILTPLSAGQLVPLFTPALSGRRVRDRQSPLADKRIGDPVASPLVHLRDAPEGPVGISHLRVDHEGSPTASRDLVRAGALASLLYDAATAASVGQAPTGNGLRNGVSGGVTIRPVNLEMLGGATAFDEVVQGAERAVLVNDSLMGGFVANEVTGDFSLVAPFAYLVERGRVVHALPPTTLAGNVHRALLEVRGVSSERRELATGTFPGLRLGGVSCAT